MYQLRLHRIPNDGCVISSSSYQYDSHINFIAGSSPVSRLPLRVSPKLLTEGLSSFCCRDWHNNGGNNEIRARFSAIGLSSRSREFLGGGHGTKDLVKVSGRRLRAYGEEDWAKLFQPEPMNKAELKEYLNEDPIWLWVLKSWQSGIKGVLLFLWTQPGQIKHIEWPSFKSTVKMALLTLVVVMFLMVFLSTVDSLFRYILKSSI